MNLLFGRKENLVALAEVLEDGRAIMNREMKKAKYNDYRGAEPFFDIGVRVQPDDEPPFEAKMKAALSRAYLLKPGVRVQVRYDAGAHAHLLLDDENQAILDRNPQLIKKP